MKIGLMGSAEVARRLKAGQYFGVRSSGRNYMMDLLEALGVFKNKVAVKKYTPIYFVNDLAPQYEITVAYWTNEGYWLTEAILKKYGEKGIKHASFFAPDTDIGRIVEDLFRSRGSL
jgi:hypothetical protein